MNHHAAQHLTGVACLAIVVAIVGHAAAQVPVAAEKPEGAPLTVGFLPEEYRPMEAPPRFNSNQPSLIPDSAEESRLKFESPQWMKQFLQFPPPSEIIRSLGNATPESRKKAAEAVAQILNPRFLPPDFGKHLIPLSQWAVLYEDWRSHGGTDLFLTKYLQDNHVVVLGESHNHIIVLVRDLGGSRNDEIQAMVKKAAAYADAVLNEHIKPATPDAMRLFRTSISPPYVYGYYTPKIEALTSGLGGDLSTSQTPVLTEQSTGAHATAVRYFSNGDFVAFMVLKPAYAGNLKNPFEPRFQALNLTREDVPFWERHGAPGSAPKSMGEQVVRKQVEEYLGSYFFDEQGNRLSDKVTYKDLERAYLELSPDQRLAIVEHKIIDEYYSEGMKAFVADDYERALDYWSRILQPDLDPENPRAAILLQVAIKQHADKKQGGDVEKARRASPKVAEALDAISRQQTRLSMRQEQKNREQVKIRAVVDFRTRAVNYLSEGNYAASLKEWNKLLGVDPGNPSALFFKEICEDRVKQQQGGIP